MPVESGRTTKRKRINLPNGGFVDVPVITEISFVDETDRAQETVYTIDNTSASSREVHVDTVYPSNTAPASGMGLEVERIDMWPVIDSTDRAQETQVTLDNVTGNDTRPPRFTTHAQTHVVRYKNPDTGLWIDVEVIDQLSVIDAVDRGQESQLFLAWLDEQADPADDDISDTANGIDPPWRLDPFQNIIDWASDDWIVVAFVVTLGDTRQSVYPGNMSGVIYPRDPVSFALQATYLTSWTTALNYDGGTGTIISENPFTPHVFLVPGDGLTWSYSGGSPDTQVTGPYLYATPSPGELGTKIREVPTSVGPYLGFTVEDTAHTHEFLDTLTVDVDVWAWPADGPWAAGTGFPDQYVQSTTASATEIGHIANIFTLGSVIQTRTFDFSTITATYKGDAFDPVALNPGTNIQVLLKRRPPTA